MFELNKIYNQNCFETLNLMVENKIKVNVILTSPPYNTSRVDTHRYDIYDDHKSEQEYRDWTVDLFNKFNEVLIQNGTVLYNISYGNECPNTLWMTISDIISKTEFMVADVISWKKSSAYPQGVSPNKLTRICEFVFVLCRKSEYETYVTNKTVSSIRETGQKMYNTIYNYIVANNNDGPCDLNKATYSTDLCNQLLKMYARKNSIVYDPFMGTGTTAVACKQLGHTYIGSELSASQCEYANNRLLGTSVIGNNIVKSTELF